MHRVTVDRSAAVAVVLARGELDAYSAPDLETAFADVGAETARRIFEITTLDSVLPVAESRALALRSLTTET